MLIKITDKRGGDAPLCWF